MKNILTLLLISISFFNCVNKNPSLNEEDYKKEQLEYEALKKKINGDKTAFFNDNKEAIMEKIRLFKKLKDTATTFSNVNTDSTFFLKDVNLNAINYTLFEFGLRRNDKMLKSTSKRNNKSEKVVFLPKREENYSKYYSFKEEYEQLYACEENANQSCEHMEVKVLKEFLDIKYAFIFEGFTIIKPSLDKKDSFSSGLFYCDVLVYDIINNKPLYKYSFSATNSKQISYRESNKSYLNEKPIDVIKNDFRKNIRSALYKETKKYFNFK